MNMIGSEDAPKHEAALWCDTPDTVNITSDFNSRHGTQYYQCLSSDYELIPDSLRNIKTENLTSYSIPR